MVRVGLFGAFDGDDAVTAAVLRAELARRIPQLELRTYTPSGRPGSTGFAEPVSWSDQPLGAFGSVRQEELAATLDAVVIAGPVALDPGRHAPERSVGGGPRSPSSPTCRSRGSPCRRRGSPRRSAPISPAKVLLARVGIWVSGHDSRDRLAALGAASVRVVPHPALALPRLAAAADMPQVVERLRAAAVLPPGDYVALDEGAPGAAPGGAGARGRRGARGRFSSGSPRSPRPPRTSAPRRPRARSPRPTVARLCGSPRPRMRRRSRSHSAAVATSPPRSCERACIRHPDRGRGLRAEFDAAFDALVEALAPAEDDRAGRALRAPSARGGTGRRDREQDLLAYNERLNTEIVAKGPRFTALWRKIHEADRHYHWHKLRADRADEEIEKLWRLHEDRLSIRMKRKVRSTKVGDAAARALGAGPVVPPPDAELGPEGPDAPSA